MVIVPLHIHTLHGGVPVHFTNIRTAVVCGNGVGWQGWRKTHSPVCDQFAVAFYIYYIFENQEVILNLIGEYRWTNKINNINALVGGLKKYAWIKDCCFLFFGRITYALDNIAIGAIL